MTITASKGAMGGSAPDVQGHNPAASLPSAGGQPPPSTDSTSGLGSLAALRQTLLEAAKDVLTEMNETARVLLDTEQLKDVWSVRIAGVQSFKDIEELGQIIPRLQLPSHQTPPTKATATANATS